MERLPELSGLSHADKDQLIRFLRESLLAKNKTEAVSCFA
jgi:hypothetical protein